MKNKKFLVSVIGGHKKDESVSALAEEIGRVVGESGAVLVCGGLGGVMESAAKGAKHAGGTTLGIIPGEDKESANDFIDIVVPTGMGYSRNVLVASAGDIVIALPGEYGTLSEIGFALVSKKTVYGFSSWDIPGVIKLSSVDELRKVINEHLQLK
ncbi:MAG: TIGR00725 family protein [Candidatus Omnitrophota bacterium]